MSRLRPTQAVDSVLDLDLPQLLALGKRVLIFDLDNTLCRRATKTLDPKLSRYIAAIQQAEFQGGILTNRQRNAEDPIVHALRESLFVVTAAGKPKRTGYMQLLQFMRTRPETAVMIGDKRWTDIWGANRMVIYSIQVKKIPRIPTLRSWSCVG